MTRPGNARKRILFVAMAESVHSARWISQIVDQEWEISLFPVHPYQRHPLLRGITFFNSARVAGYLDLARERLRGTASTHYRELALSAVIRMVRPDLVHSLEMQHAAYLTQAALKRTRRVPWYVSNWGSDVSLFSRLASDRERVQAVLRDCDYYSCECERDVSLARELGLRGQVMPVLPNAGGIDVARALPLRQPGPISARRRIVLKGYQHWAGRALVGLQALRMCADQLASYGVDIFSASPETRIAAELFAQDTGIPVTLVPSTSHEAMLEMHGRARIYLGLSISDGISTSLLEAMTMGAFPIQSCGACAGEWFADGVGGLIVPSDDPEAIAGALRRALGDDGLVDRAAALNSEVVYRRLDAAVIQPQVVQLYRDILES